MPEKKLFISLAWQKHSSSTDCFLLLSHSIAGPFLPLKWIKICFTGRDSMRRKEINYPALLHKSADDYSTLTLKIMPSKTFTRKQMKNFISSRHFTFPSVPTLPICSRAKNSFFIKFKFIVCDEVIVRLRVSSSPLFALKNINFTQQRFRVIKKF